MTEIDVAALRAAAEKATLGPWAAADEGRGERYVYDEPTGNMCWTLDLEDHWRPDDAAYIAAVSPDVLIALLDRLERAEGAVGRVRNQVAAVWDDKDGMSYGWSIGADEIEAALDGDS